MTLEDLKTRYQTAIESANEDQLWAIQIHSSIMFLANLNYSKYDTFEEAWQAAEDEALATAFENEQ